jgi:ribosomal-protein-serine acetyltransferase
MRELPERIEGDGLLLRRWRVRDAERLHKAIVESADHLRPWMAWIADEPGTVQQRRQLLAGWEQEWADGADSVYAVLVGETVAGSCGLHRRIGAGALEIGYWIHAAFLRRRLATKAAALLTDAAFALRDIGRVEIHHDRANAASAGVPRRLGYRFVGQQHDEASAPSDTGFECVWRIERDQWASVDAQRAEPRVISGID